MNFFLLAVVEVTKLKTNIVEIAEIFFSVSILLDWCVFSRETQETMDACLVFVVVCHQLLFCYVWSNETQFGDTCLGNGAFFQSKFLMSVNF